MLAEARIDRPKFGDGDVNVAGKIASRVAANKGPIINIWNFLWKLELSNYLM